MPRVPKWMANAMEKYFSGSYHSVRVTEVTHIDTKLKRVRFEGDFSSTKKDFVVGNIIEFRVTDTEFRHYTPSLFDKSRGICDVLFYLHGKGSGSTWASELNVNESYKLIGPGGKINFNSAAEFHIFFGDETSLGFMQCMYTEAIRLKHKYLCIAELDESHFSWPQLLGIDAILLKKSLSDKAVQTCEYLKKWLDETKEDITKMTFYLSGNAKSIKNIRNTLKMIGIEKNQIQSESYWVEGKRGL